MTTERKKTRQRCVCCEFVHCFQSVSVSNPISVFLFFPLSLYSIKLVCSFVMHPMCVSWNVSELEKVI